MSISEPFIRRPVATTLLMSGLTLAGLVGFRQLPDRRAAAGRLSDHRRLDRRSPGPAPRRWPRRSPTPLERQFGQMPSLAQMTSVSSCATSSQITLQFTLDRNIDVAEQDVQAAINAASNLLPRTCRRRRPTARATRPTSPILTLAITSDTLPLGAGRRLRRLDPGAEDLPGLGRRPGHAQRRRRSRRCACRSTPRRSPAPASPSRTSGWRWSRRTSTSPRAPSTAPRQDYTLATNDQLERGRSPSPRWSSPTRTARRCACRTWRTSSTAWRTRSSPAGPTSSGRSSSTSSASRAPTSSRSPTGSRRSCRSSRPASRRASTCRSSPTAPRRCAPRWRTWSSRCCSPSSWWWW